MKSFSVLKRHCERAAFCFEEKFADTEDARFSNDVKFRKDCMAVKYVIIIRFFSL